MACGVNNRLARLCVKDGAGTVDFSSGATGIEFTSESLNSAGSLLRSAGIRGTRANVVSQTRRGPYTPGGAFNFDVSCSNLLQLGEYALGAEDTGVLSVAETLPVFGVMVDKVSDVVKFEDCKASRLVIRGTAGGLITGTFECLARNYSSDSLTYPSITLGVDAIDSPLAFSDLVLTVGGTGYECGSFELIIDNVLTPSQRNALYPGCLREEGRLVTLNVNVPSTGTAWAALDEPELTGVAASLAFTSTLAAVGATVSLPVLQKARNLPAVSGPGEQTWDLSFEAVADADDDEIEITVDTTE